MWALCIFLLIGKLATSMSAADPKVTHRIRPRCEEIKQDQDIGRSVVGDFTGLARTGEEIQQVERRTGMIHRRDPRRG